MIRDFLELDTGMSVSTIFENPFVLVTVPTDFNSRNTATCVSDRPEFSPRSTFDTSLSSATATRTFAEDVLPEDGSGAVCTFNETLPFWLPGAEANVTGTFCADAAFPIAWAAALASLPTNSNSPSTTICGV